MADNAGAKLGRRIRIARGEEPGDLLLIGGSVVNVYTESTECANRVGTTRLA